MQFYINNDYFNATDSFNSSLRPIESGLDYCSMDSSAGNYSDTLIENITIVFSTIAILIGGIHSGFINEFDLGVGSCDLSEGDEAEELDLFHLIVDRDRLAQNPLSYMTILSEACLSGKKLQVEFIDEPGVDAGGLTKELFQLFFNQLLTGENGSSRSIFSVTEEELDSSKLTRSDFYKIIFTDIFGYIKTQDAFLIESVVDEGLIEKALALPLALFLQAGEAFRKTGSYEEPLTESLLLSFSGLFNERIEDDYTRSINLKCLKFLNKEKVDFSEIENFAQAIEGVEEEDLEVLQADKEAYDRFVFDTIRTQVNQQFSEQSKNLFHFIFVLLGADVTGKLEKRDIEKAYDFFKNNKMSGSIFAGVQAPFNKMKAISSIVLSESVSEENRGALLEKVNLLKEGLESFATDEEVNLFVRYVTGSSVLKDDQKIKIGLCSSEINYIEAFSCFDLLLLHLPTEVGRDDTAENLVRTVISAMQDLSYTNR